MGRMVMGLIVGLVFPVLAWGSPGALENPQGGSTQSGIGIVSGWKCTAKTVTVSFDGGSQIPVAYGTPRADTQSVCGGNANTGFGLLLNWNLLGDGTHTMKALADGVQFASATFTVKTLGYEFLSGLSGQGTVVNFDKQINVKVQWQESCQCFVIVDSTAPIRLGPPTGVNLGPSVPLCEQPDTKRLAAASAAYAFAQQAGFLHHNVQLCAVSTDNPRLYVQFQGNTYPISGDALSHPQGYIFYDVTLLNEVDGIDEFSSTFILAHELGHQVQYENPPLNAQPTLQRELQADCFGGIYLGHLAATGQLMNKDEGGLAEALCGVLYLKQLQWVNPTHGTCEQRVYAAKKGGLAEYNWEVYHISYNPFQVCSF